MQKLIETVIMIGVAVLMFGLAYAIGVKHKMHLIAGYNERTAKYVTDKPGLARLIVRLCILVGIASALMPLVTHLWGATSRGLTMCIGHYGGFILGVVALTALQSREYVAPSSVRRRLRENSQAVFEKTPQRK